MPSSHHTPTIIDVINHPYVTEVAISPDGQRVVYETWSANWAQNRYEMRCFLHDCTDHNTEPLPEFAQSPRWLDRDHLSLLYDQVGTSVNQVWLFREGKSIQVTAAPGGVYQYWLYGHGVIYRAASDRTSETDTRTQRYGTYVHVDHEPRTDDLFYVRLPEFNPDAKVTEDTSIIRLTHGLDANLRIRNLITSSHGLYLNGQTQADFDDVSTWHLALTPEALEQRLDAEIEREHDLPWIALDLPPHAAIMAVEPHGQRVLINWDGGRTDYFSNEPWAIWIGTPSSDGHVKDLQCLTDQIDRQLLDVRWHSTGIYIRYFEDSSTCIACVDDEGRVTEFEFDDRYPVHLPPRLFDIAEDGSIAFVAASKDKLHEVVVAPGDEKNKPTAYRQTKPATWFYREAESWNLGTVESVTWQSPDDVEIEGVLYKPVDFDPTRTYPLIVISHGGPATIAPQWKMEWEDFLYYPVWQFVGRDILVLKPNYRGSDGRGHAFIELGYKNPGFGELMDIESGVDYLIEQGYVNPDRVGCAGWSHGGYIAAMAAMHSDRFKAISMGASGTNQEIYYTTSDFYSYTAKIFGGLPQIIPEAYRKASPATYISKYKPPTLIQHGEEDAVNHVMHAQAMYRALVDYGVPVEFFRYPGLGHGTSAGNPKAALAIMSQNLKWFSHHLLNMPLDWDKPDSLEGSW